MCPGAKGREKSESTHELSKLAAATDVVSILS
jgi:hypothetical protein